MSIVLAASFSFTRDEWLTSFLRLADAAEEKKDFTGSRACLREIGLAMGNWYEAQPDQSDNKLEIIIRKL